MSGCSGKPDGPDVTLVMGWEGEQIPFLLCSGSFTHHQGATEAGEERQRISDLVQDRREQGREPAGGKVEGGWTGLRSVSVQLLPALRYHLLFSCLYHLSVMMMVLAGLKCLKESSYSVTHFNYSCVCLCARVCAGGNPNFLLPTQHVCGQGKKPRYCFPYKLEGLGAMTAGVRPYMTDAQRHTPSIQRHFESLSFSFLAIVFGNSATCSYRGSHAGCFKRLR